MLIKTQQQNNFWSIKLFTISIPSTPSTILLIAIIFKIKIIFNMFKSKIKIKNLWIGKLNTPPAKYNK